MLYICHIILYIFHTDISVMIHIKISFLSFSMLFLSHSTSPSGHSCEEDVYTVPKNNYIKVSMNILLLLMPAVKVNVKTTT